VIFITGHGRSGTLYTVKVLRKLSLNVGHETYNMKMDAVVSWWDVNKDVAFQKVFLQLRNPLKVIASSEKIKGSSFRLMLDTLKPKTKFKNRIHKAMYTWLYWNKHIEDCFDIDHYYWIEDFEKQIYVILKLLNLELPYFKVSNAVKSVNTNTHTRGKTKDLTWDLLSEIDSQLTKDIQEYSRRHGKE